MHSNEICFFNYIPEGWESFANTQGLATGFKPVTSNIPSDMENKLCRMGTESVHAGAQLGILEGRGPGDKKGTIRNFV